jgi:hypothetical protein
MIDGPGVAAQLVGSDDPWNAALKDQPQRNRFTPFARGLGHTIWQFILSCRYEKLVQP